jgi:sugar phosphate isomerase/epimerase
MNILTGISDEAGVSLDAQIRATRELGWRHIELREIEVPGFPAGNVHDVPDAAFDQLVRTLEAANVRVYGFASAIMNWTKTLADPFDVTLAEVRRAIPRMQRLGTTYVRIMSFKPGDDECRIPAEVLRRVGEVVKRFLDAGLQPVHENCMNYGGMSWRHAQELLDKCPGLKWVFDTGNPMFNPDRSRPRPWSKQDPWEFWEHVRDRVAHIHVKDVTWNVPKNDGDYTWPGEGQGRVRDILADALHRDYNGAFSIEPHMVVVFHHAGRSADVETLRENYVEYGRRLEALLRDLTS